MSQYTTRFASLDCYIGPELRSPAVVYEGRKITKTVMWRMCRRAESIVSAAQHAATSDVLVCTVCAEVRRIDNQRIDRSRFDTVYCNLGMHLTAALQKVMGIAEDSTSAAHVIG
jgi:hypothetical protein